MFLPKGIIPPVVTPFFENGSIDYITYEKVINYLIDSGVHGVFPMGTTGEFYAVDDDQYIELLENTVRIVNGRVDVYAGVSAISTNKFLEKVKCCEKIKGIDAISVLTPMFVLPSQEELYIFYKTIAESTFLPIIIYNNKPKTNVTITPETICRLAEIPNIVGVKDSTGDFTNTIEYLRLTKNIPNFNVLIGRDTLIYSALCCGASGSIASCANVAPALVVEIYNKYVSGDYAGSLDAQFRLNPLRIACNMGTFPAVIKEGLVQQGLPVGKCQDPISELSNEEKRRLSVILKEIGLIK